MHPIRILFIENDPADVLLTQVVFGESHIENKIFFVSSVDQAMRFLHRQLPYEQQEPPDLIIFDLGMLGAKERDFLKQIKGEERFKSIPVIVFMCSAGVKDVAEAYALNVNCCINKPVDIEEFAQVVESIERFWLNTATLQH